MTVNSRILLLLVVMDFFACGGLRKAAQAQERRGEEGRFEYGRFGVNAKLGGGRVDQRRLEKLLAESGSEWRIKETMRILSDAHRAHPDRVAAVGAERWFHIEFDLTTLLTGGSQP